MMTTIQKLHFIEKSSTIYNIHYAQAGIGFSFYEGGYDKNGDLPFDWRKYLVIHKYYKDFESAVKGEYERLLKGGERE